MNQNVSISRISDYFGRFVNSVKAHNAISQYGINYLSETVLVPILKEVFNLPNLRNLNSEEVNTPGIDLADDQARVAFQITASNDNEKIKHTLRKFIEYSQYQKYDTLYIYILSEKGQNYSDRGYIEILGNNINFDKGKHILDFRDLLQNINAIEDYEKVKRIEQLLELQFSDPKLETYKTQLQGQPTEDLVTNLMEISFPDRLFVADLAIDRKQVVKENRLSYKTTTREAILTYKRNNGLKFSGDWIDYGNKIITFHDLSNTQHDLSKVVDIGTVTPIKPEDFYDQSPAHLRAFKALLKYCFSKQAHFQKINYYHDEKMYVFSPEDEQVITRNESWHTSKRNASRGVIRVKKHKSDKTSIWYYTHLAFSITFKKYDETWYLEICPEWFISKDGIQKHYSLHESVTSFLKRNEWNQHVLNHTKFLANYLRFGKLQSSLFDEGANKPKNFIRFSKTLMLKNAPMVNEDFWKQNEDLEKLSKMKDEDGLLEFND